MTPAQQTGRGGSRPPPHPRRPTRRGGSRWRKRQPSGRRARPAAGAAPPPRGGSEAAAIVRSPEIPDAGTLHAPGAGDAGGWKSCRQASIAIFQLVQVDELPQQLEMSIDRRGRRISQGCGNQHVRIGRTIERSLDCVGQRLPVADGRRRPPFSVFENFAGAGGTVRADDRCPTRQSLDERGRQSFITRRQYEHLSTRDIRKWI